MKVKVTITLEDKNWQRLRMQALRVKTSASAIIDQLVADYFRRPRKAVIDMACVRNVAASGLWISGTSEEPAPLGRSRKTRRLRKRRLAEILKTGEQRRRAKTAPSRSTAIGGLRTAPRDRSRRALIRNMKRF